MVGLRGEVRDWNKRAPLAAGGEKANTGGLLTEEFAPVGRSGIGARFEKPVEDPCHGEKLGAVKVKVTADSYGLDSFFLCIFEKRME